MSTTHRQVALLDSAGERVLVVEGHLPRFPGRWAGPADLAGTVGDPAAWVAGPSTREQDGTITSVLAGSGTTSLDGAWVPLADLAAHGVSDDALAAISRTARAWQGAEVDDGRAAWFRPGWLDDVLVWIDDRLAEQGRRRTGPPHPAKLWSLSAVLRVPTADRDLWFKATCDGFHGEAGLTAAVARLAPDVAPRVVAADVDHAWLLLEDIPGADDDDATRAPETAARLARLQLDTLGDRDELLAAGAPDRGLAATRDGIRSVLRDTVERPLMAEAQVARLSELETWLLARVEAYWAVGLPDVLAHGDLHLGNIAWVEGRPLLFDWTDTCLTQPLLDVRHLAQSAVQETEDPAAADAVWAAFAPAWQVARPDVDLDALWADTAVVEQAFQMVTYEQIYRAQPRVSRWELSGMVVEVVGRLLAAMDADTGVTRPTS